MAFRVVNFEEGRLVNLAAAASAAIVKGNALVDNGSGFITNAASGTAVEVHYIADETKTIGSTAGELIRAYKVGPSVRINADCDGVVSTIDVGTYADLAAAGSLNPDASTNDLFFIEKADTSNSEAVETTTRVFGYFQNCVPNS